MWQMTRNGLVSLNLKSLKKGAWFKLSKISVVDLTIRYVEAIRSYTLSIIISRLVCKILKALKNQFLQKAERIGSNSVEKVSQIAVDWGCIEATAWRWDGNFISYLGISKYDQLHDCK